jgi:hypothetical protein
MLVTRELIDNIAPTHERTSCSDTDLSNAFYSKNDYAWEHYPRCHRCFLLDHVDGSLPKGIVVAVRLELEIIPPKEI